MPYSDIFVGAAPVVTPDLAALGEFLRCALGLSAWKQTGSAGRPARWALRVNPSSGNLHPTEAYVVTGGRVAHYDPRDHALETRCAFDAAAWPEGVVCLVVLTSVHWREAWKYGERAFRYCQHDIGHALGAIRLSAARLGWSARLLPWPHDVLASLSGTDRAEDYADAEPEEPAVALLISAGHVPGEPVPDIPPAPLLSAIRGGRWTGRPTRLSPEVVPWPIIDEVAKATRRVEPGLAVEATRPVVGPRPAPTYEPGLRPLGTRSGGPPNARHVILHRRSALGFDPRGSLPLETLLAMLERLTAREQAPWDLQPWEPLVHLVLFVHRVEGLAPGIYAWLRGGTSPELLRTTLRPDFLWEPAAGTTASAADLTADGQTGLFLLAPLDVRGWAQRLSCEQDIAADGFLSLAMLARTGVIAERGGWWYRRLFWECGLIGQQLYLDAEAVGARSTGIGCFLDDAVHQVLGLTGQAWQSLYHFSMGLPVDDARLTTEPGYPWDVS